MTASLLSYWPCHQVLYADDVRLTLASDRENPACTDVSVIL
ncbi:MAG: hypothetical protein ABJR23_03295 [Paracoccaceae bacterium]